MRSYKAAARASAEERTSLKRAIQRGEYVSEEEFKDIYRATLCLAQTERLEITKWKSNSPSQAEKSQQSYDLEGLLLLLLLMVVPTQRRQVFVNALLSDLRLREKTFFLRIDVTKEKNALIASDRPLSSFGGMHRWVPLREELTLLLQIWLDKGRKQLKSKPVKQRLCVHEFGSLESGSEALFLSAAGKPWVLGDFTDRIQRLSYLVCGRRLSPRMFRKLRATYFARSVDRGEVADSRADGERLLETYARFEGHTTETLKRDYVLREEQTEEFRDILEIANRHLLPPEAESSVRQTSPLRDRRQQRKRQRRLRRWCVVDSDSEEDANKKGAVVANCKETVSNNHVNMDMDLDLEDLPGDCFDYTYCSEDIDHVE